MSEPLIAPILFSHLIYVLPVRLHISRLIPELNGICECVEQGARKGKLE